MPHRALPDRRHSRLGSLPTERGSGGGTAVAWGANSSGELGDNNATTSDVPVGVCEVGWTSGSCTSGHYLTGVAGVSAGVGFSLALMSNETVTAWGEDPNGQLGDNATANSDVPVGVCEVGWTAGSCPPSHYLAGVTAISAGNGHSLAIAPAPAVPGPHWYKKRR